MADEYITKEQAKVAFDDCLRLSTKEWNMIFDGIDALPAADVAPVRHGRWEKKHDDVCYWHECSECGERLPLNQWRQPWKSRFCQNCGAKMDTEEREAVYDPDKFFGRK